MSDGPDPIEIEASALTVLRLIDETQARLAAIRSHAEDLLKLARLEGVPSGVSQP